MIATIITAHNKKEVIYSFRTADDYLLLAARARPGRGIITFPLVAFVMPPTLFPPMRPLKNTLAALAAALLISATGAATVDTAEADALAQALAGEIALQRHLMPQAWKCFMTTAEAARDARYAERAWETAVAARSPENAALALTLWKKLAPQDSRTSVLAAAEGLLSADAKVRQESESRLKEALAADPHPAATLAKVTELTASSDNRRAVYDSLSRLAAPYAKNDAAMELVLAQSADAAGLRNKASRHAELAMKAAPDDARVIMAGIDYLFRAEPASATECLKRFLKKHPDAVPPRLALAKSYLKTGTEADVRRELAEINRRGGNEPNTVYAAGTVAEEAGLLDDAEKAYKKYLVLIRREGGERFLPDAAYARLGMVKLARGDKRRAVEWFRKVEKGDKYLPAKMKEAETLADLGETDAACEVLRHVKTDAKQHAKLLLAVVDLYLQAGRRDAAYDASREALKGSPNDPATIYKAAQLSETTSRYSEAEALLTHYIEIRPNDANGYNALGYMWLENDQNIEGAARHIERAMELSEGKDGFITDSLGWLRFKEHRFEEAEKHLRDAFRLQPDIDIALHLAEVLIVNGKPEEARGLLDLVLKHSPDNLTAQRLQKRLAAPLSTTPKTAP